MSDVEFVDVQSPSTAQTSACLEESVRNDIAKLRLKDAVVYYEELLVNNDMIASQASTVISEEAILMGEEIYNRTMEMLNEKNFIVCDELFMNDEPVEESSYEEVGSSSSEGYQPEEKKSKSEYIPLEYKVKVVNISKSHPTWTLKTLHKRGCSRLKRVDFLPKWEEQIKSGGTAFDKYATIDSWTSDRFQEARKNCQQVTTRNLQQWDLSAASQFHDFEFKALETWVREFKRKHGIRQPKITKYVSETENITVEETLAAAENFRIQALL